MPIVTGGNPISIDVEANAKQMIAEMDKVHAKLDQVKTSLKKEGEALRNQQNVMQKSTMSITDFRSAYQIMLDVVRVGQQVWAATGQEFVNYAEQVKNLSRNIGASAEDASRLIQVADDVRISYGSLGTALKIAQKGGIDTSVEGLAKLADQYNKLAPGIERTQFLMKTFGRSGLEMGKLLEKGGDGIRSMSAAIDENLIMTADGIKASDAYQKSLDEMNDSFLAVKVSVGSYLVGPATDLLNHWRDLTTSLKENGYWYTVLHQLSLDDISAKREEADAAFLAAQGNSEFADAIDETSGALDDNKEAIQAAEDALKNYKDMLEQVSKANQDAEGFIQSYSDAQADYEKSHAEASQKLKEAENQVELAAAEDGIRALEAQWHESTNKMIYDMVLAKVAVEGLTDAEFNATQDLAVSMGIRTQAQADEAKAMMEKANALADGIALQEDVMKEQQKIDAELLKLEEAKASASGATLETTKMTQEELHNQMIAMQNVTTATDAEIERQIELEKRARLTAEAYSALSIEASYSGMLNGSTKPTTKTPSRSGMGTVSGRDSGGMGMAGVPYQIGVPEIFVPKTSGEFIPLGGANAKSVGNTTTYIINITNPKRETAENSIRAALKNLSYTGAAA